MNFHYTYSTKMVICFDDIYEVRIQRISPDEHPENQVEVIVYIKNQNK